MNAHSGTLTGIAEIDSTLLDFYRLRSELLDCFADIETAILFYVTENCEKPICETAPLGHKIEAALKIKAGPKRSKSLKATADLELKKIAQLLSLRADLVHSRMELAITTKNNIVAIFQNVKNAKSIDRQALVFDLPQLREFVASINRSSISLSEALTARNRPPNVSTV